MLSHQVVVQAVMKPRIRQHERSNRARVISCPDDVRSLAVVVGFDGEGAEAGDEEAVRGELLGLEVVLLLEHHERRGHVHGAGAEKDSLVGGGLLGGGDLTDGHASDGEAEPTMEDGERG